MRNKTVRRLWIFVQRALCAVLVMIVGAGAWVPVAAQPVTPDYTAAITPSLIDAHIRALAEDIGARIAGSPEEARAAAYVQAQFEPWGYAVTVQPFAITAGDRTSQNVIAHKPATYPGPQTRTIIVGAHADSVNAGTGADDNASGVATILVVAEALATLHTQHNLVFIAFGAEEIGLLGSKAYVDALTAAQRDNILAMFNVDTVGAGDFAYVYAGIIDGSRTHNTPGPTWARDLALDVANNLNVDLRTTPPEGWDGFIGPWSDHAPFAEEGIAVAYFERWNWEGNDLFWGVETAEHGDFLHTARDTVDNVDPALAEPVAEVLASTLALLATGMVAERQP